MSYSHIKANKGIIGGVNDKVYTPPEIAKTLISKLPIKSNEILLDPCRGKGAFFDNFPTANEKYYCEIDEGKDFFDWHQTVHWIITNPPYSIYDKFVEHCFKLAVNVALLIPFTKVASSLKRLKTIKEFGGIQHIWFLSAGKCGFNFGYPCGFIWYKRNCIDNWEIL